MVMTQIMNKKTPPFIEN